MDGLDLREARVADLRSQMALVSQEIVLFNETVADNIAYGKPGATREEIEQAARSAFAHDFIVKLPQGYDTIVGERKMSTEALASRTAREVLAIVAPFMRKKVSGW